ncbi:MAG TPA: lasso peptide biosynthesis B2 protein [Streptosporangiaceae bacterium]|nr:lasso peptide biosynthesis B2 protein [Streptosporangiaceae bacterium]
MPALKKPENVFYYSHDHGGVIMLDTASGSWIALNATASDLWRSWASGSGFDDGVAAVAARHPDVPHRSILADAESLISELTARGLMDAAPAEAASDAVPGSGVAMAEPERVLNHGRLRRPLRSGVAFSCLVLASLLVRCSFRAAVRLVSASRRRWCRASSDLGAARRTVAAVGTAARYYPGKAACLELSLAAVLLAAVRRRRLDWCLGSATDPYQFHAWVELEGQAVPAPGRPAEDTRYIRVLAV